MILITLMTRDMHPAARGIVSPIPADRNATGVSNACIKTLLLRCCWVPLTALCVYVIIDNPARWTVDSRRWYRCGNGRWNCASIIWV